MCIDQQDDGTKNTLLPRKRCRLQVPIDFLHDLTNKQQLLTFQIATMKTKVLPQCILATLVLAREEYKKECSDTNNNTEEPVYYGHPRANMKWLLQRGDLPAQVDLYTKSQFGTY